MCRRVRTGDIIDIGPRLATGTDGVEYLLRLSALDPLLRKVQDAILQAIDDNPALKGVIPPQSSNIAESKSSVLLML